MEQPTEPDPFAPPRFDTRAPRQAWWGAAWLAWIVILGVAVFTIMQHRSAPADQETAQDTVGLVLVQLQGKYLVGAAHLLAGQGPVLYGQAQGLLNAGTVGQRQRFVILASELAGPVEARQQLDRLDRLIEAPPLGGPVKLTERDAVVQRILHELFPARLEDLDGTEAEEAAAAAVETLSPRDRETLADALGWFGEIASAPAGSPQHDAALRSASAVAAVLGVAAMGGILAGVLGLAGLVLLVVLALTGTIRSGLGSGGASHAIYAETFAIWLAAFIGLQQMTRFVPAELSLLAALGAFALSLGVLAWPVVRGIPWRVVRHDIGLTLGAKPWLEPLVGVAGYLATLPLLAVGLVITLTLMAIQQAAAGEVPTFGPTGGPAHPVVVYMTGPDAWPKLQVLLLAAVAAPVVEETMFRGVLYRHLRDATGRLDLVVSVLLCTGINTFLFASIHPQGFLAVPALMSLACGMTLIREWRGTLVPSIVIHGLSNGLVMSLLWIALGV